MAQDRYVYNPARLPSNSPSVGFLKSPDEDNAAMQLETDVPELISKASGTVLEVGPGSGNQLPRYEISKIERIYGVEPNVDLHDALRSRIKKHGLSDVYTIVPCGVEDLDKLREYGIGPGTMDTVTSVQVLCSVPEPAALVKELYRLLKPGGQMIVFEHVKSEDYLSYLVQCVSSPTYWLRVRADVAKWSIMLSGHTVWATVIWIALPGSTCLRLVVGLRLSWSRRRRRMPGWYFPKCLGSLSSGVLAQIEIS